MPRTYPPPVPTSCRYCAGEVIFTTNDYLYGRRYGKHPYLYICKNCEASVGVHPNSATPLGTLADAQLKTLRHDAKTLFFQYTRFRGMSRSQAYKYLRTRYDLTSNEAHFGMMEAPILKRIIADYEVNPAIEVPKLKGL